MAWRVVVINDETNEIGRGAVVTQGVGNLFDDQLSDIGGTEVTEVPFAGAIVINTTKPIDIHLGGRKVYEGVNRDFQRNIAQNRIDFNYPIKNILVDIRVWNV